MDGRTDRLIRERTIARRIRREREREGNSGEPKAGFSFYVCFEKKKTAPTPNQRERYDGRQAGRLLPRRRLSNFLRESSEKRTNIHQSHLTRNIPRDGLHSSLGLFEWIFSSALSILSHSDSFLRLLHTLHTRSRTSYIHHANWRKVRLYVQIYHHW